MFDFPNTPSDGDRVIHPNGMTYEFSTGSWSIVQEDLATLTTRLHALEQFNFLLLE